jgi:hypothetical protein
VPGAEVADQGYTGDGDWIEDRQSTTQSWQWPLITAASDCALFLGRRLGNLPVLVVFGQVTADFAAVIERISSELGGGRPSSSTSNREGADEQHSPGIRSAEPHNRPLFAFLYG